MGFTSETRAPRRVLAGAAIAHGVVLAHVLAHRPAIAPQVQVQVQTAPSRDEQAIELVANSDTGPSRDDEWPGETAGAAATASTSSATGTTRGGTGARAGAASEVPNTAAASGERPAGPLALLREGAPPPIALALFTIIAVNDDPANIGAKPRRVVHARLLDAQVL